MYANKRQEQFILNAQKQKAEKEKKKAVSKQKTSSKKATLQAPLTVEAKINVQKQKYDKAYANKDFLGVRKANETANEVREKAGLPRYSSALGDMQASLTNAKSLTGLKQNVSQQMASNANKQVANLSANHPLNRERKTVSPIPKRVLNDMFDKKENYVDKFKKGNIGGGVASLVGETIQLPQSGLMNISNNINSVTHGKGLQPYKRMMDYTDYENEIWDRNNVKPLSQLIGEKNKTLGNLYSIGMNIATDPLNLLDGAGMLKAKGLKTLGSADYSKDLLKGGKTFVPTVKKETTQVLGANGKLKNIKTIKPVNSTSGFLGQVWDKFEVSRPLTTKPIPQALKLGKTLKSGKKINSVEDLKALTPSEKIEVMSELERLAYESNVRKGKIAAQNDFLYGNSFRPTMGELPAPRVRQGRTGAMVKPTQSPTTAQAEGLFVDYYPERRAADVVKSNDFNPIAIEEGYDPEEFITIYRGAPSNQKSINNGDWVTISEQLARDYGGNVIKEKVQAKHLYAPKGEGVEELIYSTNQNVIKELPRLTPKNIYANAVGQREVPRTITPNELPSKPQPLPQAPNQAVQPQIQEKQLNNSKFFRLDNGVADVSGHIPTDGRMPFIDQIYYSSKLADDVTDVANIPSEYLGKGNVTKAVENVIDYLKQNNQDKFQIQIMNEHSKKLMDRLVKQGKVKQLTDYRFDGDDVTYAIPQAQNQAVQPQNVNSGTKTPQRPFQSVGADLNKNPSKYKVSQLRTNTIENSEQFANLKENMPQENFEYEVRPEKVTMAEAKQRLETDFEGEVEDLYTKANFDGADTDTAMGIAKAYGEEAEQTGNYARLNNWSKQIQEKATEQGQAIEAFKKYTRTPTGKVVEGQREVAKVQREIAKDNPRLTDKVNQETKDIIDLIGGAEKETLESISEMINKMLKGEESTPSDLLARKVINTTKTPKVKENAINDMVNELFRVAKESPLPSTLKTKSDPVDYLTKAIQNKELYADTWNKAKDVIKAKYGDSSDVLSMLDEYFDKGIIPTYSKATIENSIRQTAKELAVDFSKIIKQSAGDKEKALQDITNLLINKTGANGEDAELLAKNITNQYNEILKVKTESKLKQMFREVPKKGQKTTYEKVMELINMGAYDNQSIKDIIRAKNNIPVLENEDIKGIFENMKLSENVTDPYMKRMYEAKAQQIISDKIPATKMENFAGLQRQSMLINPKTLLTRNPLGNVVLGTAENIKDIPASMIDKAISLKTGQRTTTINPQIGAQLKGIAQGTKEWAKDIKYGVDTSPTRAQFELPNKRIFDNKVLNATDRFLSRALQLGDRPFYQAAYDGRMAQLKKLGVTGEEAEEQARLFALDRVFQNDSVLSKNALIIRDKLGLPGRLIMPFAQTPANIMDKLLDYSPVGLMKATSQLGTVGKGTFNQKLFVDRLGRTFTGTGIAMLGYAMASKGILTGNEYNPTNKDLNAANTKAGIQSYAIKVGDKWHSYDFAQPIGGILAAAADAYNAGQEGKDFVSSIGAGTTAAVNTVFNQSFMSGLLDAFSGYSPAEGIGGSLLSSTTQITPTILNNVTKTIDPYTRETYDPNTFKQQGNKLIARIPFASKTLPKKLDASGQPIMQSQGRGAGARTLENFLLPQKVTEVKKDIVNDELLRLNKSTGENEMLLNVAPKKFTKSGQTYTLSAKDYTNYQKTMGQYADKQMDKLIKTEDYKKLSNSDKVKALKEINETATENARMEYFENNGMSPLLALDASVQKKFSKVKDTGITDKQFIQVNKKLAGLSKQEEVQSVLDSTKLTQAQKEALWYASNSSWTEISNPYKDKNSDFNFNLMSDSKKQKFLAVANKGVSKQQYANALGRADIDDNGSIKKDELKQAMIDAGFTSEQRRAMYISFNWKAE